MHVCVCMRVCPNTIHTGQLPPIIYPSALGSIKTALPSVHNNTSIFCVLSLSRPIERDSPAPPPPPHPCFYLRENFLSVCACVCVDSPGFKSTDDPITKGFSPLKKNQEEEGRMRRCWPICPSHRQVTQPHTHTITHYPTSCLAAGDKASCTHCQPLWSQSSPAGPSGSCSGVGCRGWLVPLCNWSSASDTVQVCPLWPRLPGDCVNSPANLRKYPVGIFVKPASVAGLVFH